MNDVLMIVCPVLAEILLLFCGAFFASTETAYTAISRITVRQMIKDKEKHAERIHVLKNNLDRLISTVLIGTNFVTALASSLATAFTLKVAGPAYVSYGTAVISIFVIIFTEVLPKTYAAVKTKETAQMSAVPVTVIQVLIFPIVWIFSQLVLRKSVRLLLRRNLKHFSNLEKMKVLLRRIRRECLTVFLNFQILRFTES